MGRTKKTSTLTDAFRKAEERNVIQILRTENESLKSNNTALARRLNDILSLQSTYEHMIYDKDHLIHDLKCKLRNVAMSAVGIVENVLKIEKECNFNSVLSLDKPALAKIDSVVPSQSRQFNIFPNRQNKSIFNNDLNKENANVDMEDNVGNKEIEDLSEENSDEEVNDYMSKENRDGSTIAENDGKNDINSHVEEDEEPWQDISNEDCGENERLNTILEESTRTELSVLQSKNSSHLNYSNDEGLSSQETSKTPTKEAGCESTKVVALSQRRSASTSPCDFFTSPKRSIRLSNLTQEPIFTSTPYAVIRSDPDIDNRKMTKVSILETIRRRSGSSIALPDDDKENSNAYINTRRRKADVENVDLTQFQKCYVSLERCSTDLCGSVSSSTTTPSNNVSQEKKPKRKTGRQSRATIEKEPDESLSSELSVRSTRRRKVVSYKEPSLINKLRRSK